MDQSTDDVYSSIDELLPECKHHILQFLSLKDCLRFTSTSKKNLLATLAQLRQRRQEQFYQRYCYQLENPTVLRRRSDKKWDPNKAYEKDDALFSSRLMHKQQWYTIPSTGERIIQLYRCIPASHSANKDLQILKAILVQDDGTNQMEDDDKEPPSFHKTLRQLGDCTRAHKLHASILTKSTVDCIPRTCARYSTNTARAYNDNNPNTMSVTLETYLGDVLVAYFLMGNKIAGIIEGGPSLDEWNIHITGILQDGERLNAIRWYRIWVYLHSTLLRTFPFSIDQAKTLVGQSHGILGHTIPQDVHYVHPHYCYIGLHQVQQTTKIVRRLQLELCSNPHEPIMTTLQTTMSQFGPLGPAFRGRDEIRTCIMNPVTMLIRLAETRYVLPPTWALVEQEEHVILDSSAFDGWFRGRDAVARWMVELKEECSKSRPMTVMPPVVTLEPIAMVEFLLHNTLD